jgi:branched-chain amino acid transport system ATP-binding protein
VTALLDVRDLRVRYGHAPALRGVHLTVAQGELVAVAGANGAGKSTLVNAVAGWSRGTPVVTGQVRFGGQDLAGIPAHRRAALGVALVPEGKGVFEELTVEENLRLVRPPKAATGRRFAIEDIYRLFGQLRERAGARCSTLSGGERQMVALGRALRAAPRLLILDEPSVGLAPRLVMDMLRQVRELADDGLAVLLVEQNVRASLDLAHRLYLLERGTVVASGDAGQMRGDDRIVAAYLGGLRR